MCDEEFGADLSSAFALAESTWQKRDMQFQQRQHRMIRCEICSTEICTGPGFARVKPPRQLPWMAKNFYAQMVCPECSRIWQRLTGAELLSCGSGQRSIGILVRATEGACAPAA